MDAQFHDDGSISLHPQSNRPYSSDFSLDLEHQLEADSLPNSPLPHTHNQTQRQELDATVLASIVTNLRLSLAEVTRERDMLHDRLAQAMSHEEGVKETLEHVTDKCIRLETDLAAARDKNKDDEDAIAMLRSKVEESRRALMRLQTESRRMSANLTLDLSRPPPAHASLSGPPSSRRTSFTPLTGSSASMMGGHRRISSVSDSGLQLASNGESSSWPPPPSPGFQMPLSPGITPTDRQQSTSHNRRVSLLFGRTPSTPTPEATAESHVLELRKDLLALRKQLEDTKRELAESQEAQEASDLCVKALRTFIAENNVGMSISTDMPRAPHPPSATTARASTDERRDSPMARWGFRLWSNGADGEAGKSASPVTPVAAPGHTRQSSRFGLFGARTSVSSTSSSLSRPAMDSTPQEPPFHGSDTSSVAESPAEPISPVSDEPVLLHVGVVGKERPREDIITAA